MAGSTGEVWMSANERNALSATCDQVSPPCFTASGKQVLQGRPEMVLLRSENESHDCHSNNRQVSVR